MSEIDEFREALYNGPNNPHKRVVSEVNRRKEEQRQLALVQQRARHAELRRLEEERLVQEKIEELERQRRYRLAQELLGYIDDCRRRRWIYEENTLLLGTLRDHPLEGLTLDIPDFLHDLCYDRRHKTELPIWFRGNEMGLTFGATGSGKFTSVIAANVMYYSGGVFAIDPKGEICGVTGYARRKKNQDVYRLDPLDVTKFNADAYHVPRATYNPLDALDPDTIEFTANVGSLVESLVTSPTEGENKFFVEEAKALIQALIMFVRSEPIFEEERNLSLVYSLLCSNDEERDVLLEQMALSIHRMVKTCGKAHTGMDARTRNNIWASARTETRIFLDPVIEEITRTSSFDLRQLFNGGCTVYLVLDNNYLDSHNRWLRMMMAVALMEASRRRKDRSPDAHTLWIIDEARQLGSLPLIPRAYRLLRTYGVRMWTFWQSLQDLQTSYPQDWSSMLENSFVQLLKCNGLETAKYFSELGGEYQETHLGTGHSRAESWAENSSFTTGRSGSGGVSKGPQGSTTTFSSGGSSSETEGTSHSVTLTDSTTRSWQWSKRIQINDILTMPHDQMYLRCPGELAGFVNKHFYHDNELLNDLASGNPYYGGPKPIPILPPLQLGRVTKKPEFPDPPNLPLLTD